MMRRQLPAVQIFMVAPKTDDVTASSDPAAPQGPVSTSAPLRRPMFLAIWIASIVSATGTWMHEIGAGWLMVGLNPDPFMVSLVQASVVLPAFFLALPAGAIADIFDRRLYMIVSILWLVAMASGLAAVTLAGKTTTWVLLTFTFGMGIGNAMLMPAFAALIPDLVPRRELTAAVTLNGIGMNLTRAVGPAIAGILVAAFGPGLVFVLNAVSYTGLLVVIYRYRSTQPRSTLPSERFFGAVRVGLRFARQSPRLQTAIIRGVSVFLMMSAMWAFLPIIARVELGQDAEVYGLLLSSLGAGAVTTGLLLSRVRSRFSAERVLLVGTLAAAAVLFGLAYVRNLSLLCVVLFIGGASWISCLSTLQVAAQLALPRWVRARGLAIFLASFMGSMAVGVAAWGRLASATSISTALASAALFGLAVLAITGRMKLHRDEDEGLLPAEPIPDPNVALPMDDAEGPVKVSINYRVSPTDATEFTASMRDVRRMRLRNGAVAWGLYQDAEDPELFLETFLEESWLDHLRQHERQTVEDREFRRLAEDFHIGPEPPRVMHFIARRAPRRARRWLWSGTEPPESLGNDGDER
jgi:predicted MFS family arabinose efflux permease